MGQSSPVDRLRKQLQELARGQLVGQQLLEGTLLAELEKLADDLRKSFQLPEVFAEYGVVVGFDLMPPAFGLNTIKGLTQGKMIAG